MAKGKEIKEQQARDKTTLELSKLTKASDVHLINIITRIIESHTRENNAESRIIWCSSGCLAKEIAQVVHHEIESQL